MAVSLQLLVQVGQRGWPLDGWLVILPLVACIIILGSRRIRAQVQKQFHFIVLLLLLLTNLNLVRDNNLAFAEAACVITAGFEIS